MIGKIILTLKSLSDRLKENISKKKIAVCVWKRKSVPTRPFNFKKFKFIVFLLTIISLVVKTEIKIVYGNNIEHVKK